MESLVAALKDTPIPTILVVYQLYGLTAEDSSLVENAPR